MTSMPAPILGPYDSARHAIREYAATRRDLMNSGYTDYSTRSLVHEIEPRELRPTESVAVPVGTEPPIAALVPVSDIALEIARFGAYIRAEELSLPVHLRASHIGWAQDGKVCMVRPILERFRIGSYRAIPGLGIAPEAQLMSTPSITLWDGPATLFVLGEEESMSVELGYRSNRGGGVQGIAGTRHYQMKDLRAASKDGTRLVELSTA